MPLFEYVCGKCHARTEILVRGGETPVCPECGSTRMTKQASAFAPATSSPRAASMPAGCESCCGRQNGTCPHM
jgi:putative FmdB family regulatory protein